MAVDIAFPFALGIGQRLPLDHGYTLFSALSRAAPDLHRNHTWALALVGSGEKIEGGMIVTSASSVRMRIPPEDLPKVVSLIRYSFRIFDQEFTLGEPSIHLVQPSKRLYSPLVVFTGMELSQGEFKERVIAQIHQALPPSSFVDVRLGRYRRMRVKGAEQGGYGVWVDGLEPPEALILQFEGIGGRRHMGAGFFLPPEISF